ncbi:hypothetical protein GCM10029964_051030 [Kibdelosporangium lantanae]
MRLSLWRRYLRRPLGVAALAVFVVVVVTAGLASVLAPYDPNHVNFALTHAAPGNGHLLGGDSAGRDILSRLLYGARTTLYGAVITCATGLLLGVPAGVTAGYFGGITDRVCSWISDALQSVPGMIVLLVVAAGTGQNFTVLMVALGVFLAPGYFRIARARALAVRKEPYIDAARVAGLTNVRILRTHMLRAVYAPIIVQTALTAGIAIGMQAGLQFLGVGSASTPSWGQMMNDGFQTMLTYPLILLWPSIALGITIAALAFIGSTLADLVSVRTEPPPRKATVTRGNRAVSACTSRRTARCGSRTCAWPTGVRRWSAACRWTRRPAKWWASSVSRARARRRPSSPSSTSSHPAARRSPTASGWAAGGSGHWGGPSGTSPRSR